MKKIKKLSIAAITALTVATAASSFTSVRADEAQQARIEATDNDKRMAQIGGAIRHFLGDKTPIAFKSGLKSGQVNAYYEGDSDNFTVYYSKGKEGKNFNDPDLKDTTPYVTIEKKTYASSQEAKSAINYSNGQAQMGLPKIQLGSGLTGTLDNDDGQKFIHWNSDKWSMTVRSTGTQDPTVTARQTLTITFDPSSLYAQTLVQTLRLSKLFKVEESPYDMRYVKMVESAEKGKSHRISRDQLWK